MGHALSAAGGGPRSRPALVSVIVAVRNGERYLSGQLEALALQSYGGRWELIVVDNGCTDRSMAIARGWHARLPGLRLTDASDRRGLNHARAAGAAAARGELLAFCDADDAVAPGWLEALVRGALNADLVGGATDTVTLNGRLSRAWQGWPPPVTTQLNSGYGFLPYVSGGNCGVWIDVARCVGWDRSFSFGASDIEFAWRAQLAGFRVAFAPDAILRRRDRTTMLAMAAQYFRYGSSLPLLYRRFRRHGMPRASRRQTLHTLAWLVARAPQAVLHREMRGNWLRVAAGSCGRAWGSLRWRAIYI